jgi:cytidylate kinase
MSTDPSNLVVTISATYGAGGSRVGPRVAEELGVPFVDRAIPAAVAERLGWPLPDADAQDDAGPHGLNRLLRSLVGLGPMSGIDLRTDFGDRSFADATEAEIRRHAETTGGVVVGRAGAVVLRDRPGALHVRLDAPVERRVEQAMAINGTDRETARRRVHENDAARRAYVETFYGADARDPALYHLVLDSTAVPLETCVEIVVGAARAVTAPAGVRA